jgi:hypothetical protein
MTSLCLSVSLVRWIALSACQHKLASLLSVLIVLIIIVVRSKLTINVCKHVLFMNPFVAILFHTFVVLSIEHSNYSRFAQVDRSVGFSISLSKLVSGSNSSTVVENERVLLPTIT